MKLFRGRGGLVLTLTYMREPYSGPLDLYRRQSDERHLRRFMEKLGRVIHSSLEPHERTHTADGSYSSPLSGRWFAKMEFQEGGWVHWHVLLKWDRRIDWEAIRDAWGHGRIFVQKATPQRLRYVAKYLAKPEDVPAFLLGERPRSVKIIRVSPGFWEKDPEPSRTYEHRPRPHSYVPLGVRMRHQRRRTAVRRVGSRIVNNFDMPFDQLAAHARRSGCKVLKPLHRGWCRFDRPIPVPVGGAACGDPGRSLFLSQGQEPPGWVFEILREQWKAEGVPC